MNQSSFIAGTLLAGFVLFLAANNRLSLYTAVLWGAASSGAATKSNVAAPSGPGSAAPALPQQTASSGPSQTGGINLSGIQSFVSQAGSVLSSIGGFFGL